MLTQGAIEQIDECLLGGSDNSGMISIGCFNARSLCNKTAGVLELLKQNDISICCITETWLKSDDRAKFSEIHDMGFDVISAPRKGRGGGVGFLFDPKVLSPIRNDVSRYSSFEVIECVIKRLDKTMRLCTVYRNTQAKSNYEETKISKFMTDFDEYLDILVSKVGSPIICGDFNFHVENDSDKVAQNFLALCSSKGFLQHISSPTHISGGTLDLVLTMENIADSLPLSNIQVETNTGTTSDHFFVSFQVPIPEIAEDDPYEEKEIRELKKIDVNKFREDVFTSALNLSEYKSLDETVQMYNNVLLQLLNKHAPVIVKRFKGTKSEFWDEQCQSARTERRKAKRKMKKNPDDLDLKHLYGEKSIDAEAIINNARNRFYDKLLHSHKGDARATYKVVNGLLDKEYGANKVPNGDETSTANRLKSFFDTKVKTIYQNIEAELDKNPPNDNQNSDEDFSVTCRLSGFETVSMNCLEKIILDLPNKSSKLDIIPIWLFKNCLPELLPVVYYIVNESLRLGKFPSALKQASIRPGLKKPTLDVDDLKNYRPISNLSYLSKILEKVVHEQLNCYVDKNGLFSPYQSGYRRAHSCETAITKIHNDILMMIDKKTNVVLLLLDLSAAFDTISHDLLLKKLRNLYGITDTAIKWLQSYLQDRSFNVTVRNGTSENCQLKIGVPQGSILGPLLFILYTKDLEQIVTKYGFSIHLYADDTQVYFTFDVHQDNPDMSAVKSCFLEIKKWMSVNFLKLNDSKTEFIDIGPYISNIHQLDLGELSISPVTKAKNLGFWFDDQLSLDAQINAVSQICYLNQRNLSRIGSKLSHELKVQLVHGNILCFIDYCNSVYSKLTEKNVQKLQKIQNNAVRFIYGLYGKRSKEPISPYLKKLHFLPVRFRIKFKLCLLVFKCLNDLAPKYLKDLIFLREVKRRSSRLDDDFFMLKVPPCPNFHKSQGAFSYIGPKTWNELPYSIRSMNNVDSFKTVLKTYFFNIAFQDVN